MSHKAKESLNLLTSCRSLKNLALQNVYKLLPKCLLSYLNRLRVKLINFPNTLKTIQVQEEARKQMNSLKQVVTNDKCLRTRGEKKRAAKQRDNKVSRLTCTIAIYSNLG